MHALRAVLGNAGGALVLGVPGAHGIMLNYQSTSFHDVLAVRQLLGRRPAPEFEAWLGAMGLVTEDGLVRPASLPAPFAPLLAGQGGGGAAARSDRFGPGAAGPTRARAPRACARP